MKKYMICLVCVGAVLLASASVAHAAGRELVIAAHGKTKAVIVVSDQAEGHEKRAADDLAKYIGLMCGATPEIANTQETIDAAMSGKAPVMVVGREALKAKPELRGALNRMLKRKPYLRTDGIVLRREGNRAAIYSSVS
jgi:hypothetical protein